MRPAPPVALLPVVALLLSAAYFALVAAVVGFPGRKPEERPGRG